MITFSLTNSVTNQNWAKEKLSPDNYAILESKLLICISNRQFKAMSYVADPFTGDTMHVKRQSGVYPVKVEKHHTNVVLMQYDSLGLLFHEIGCDAEYWKECDLYCVGDLINLN